MSNDTDVVSEPRPSRRAPITSMRLPVDLRAQVAEAAPDRSMGSVIREALTLWLEGQTPARNGDAAA